MIAALFSLLCDKALKKHAGAFYIAAVVLAAIAAGCTYAGITAGFSIWFSTWIWPLVARGALGTALFVVVMLTGALPNGSAAMKKLMPIRGELSIIASILTLGHNITYGKTYFVMHPACDAFRNTASGVHIFARHDLHNDPAFYNVI